MADIKLKDVDIVLSIDDYDILILIEGMVERAVKQIAISSLNLSGGIGVPNSLITEAGKQAPLFFQKSTRNYHAFLDRTTSKNISYADYQLGDNYTTTGDITFYTIWKEATKKTFTIIYNENVTDIATGIPTIQIKTQDIGISDNEDIPVRDGYVFVHWSESSNDSGASYNPGDLYTKDNNVTLYAIWKQEHKNMYIGSSSVSSIYVGSDKVTAMYIETTKVW